MKLYTVQVYRVIRHGRSKAEYKNESCWTLHGNNKKEVKAEALKGARKEVGDDTVELIAESTEIMRTWY